MSKKLIYLMFGVLVLGFANSGWGVTKIIVVTDNPANEAGLEPFLKSLLGIDISVEIEDEKYRTLDATKRANLEAADLIIVSRQTNSGDYNDGSERALWNGLATPILLHSAYLSRDSRWRWLQGNQHDADGLTHVAVVDESNMIFNGVNIVDGQVQIFPTPIDNTDVSAQDSAGNGTKIATPAGSTDVMIASWDAGVEYYPGSGEIAGGPRISFLMLRPYQFFPTLTDDGKKILGNAVLILLRRLRGDPIALDPVPADAETDVPRDVVLTWTPGELANTHDVYLGTVFDDVNEADRTDPRNVLLSQGQDANTFDPGRLEFGRTYYWRINEVNAPPDSTIFKGMVWSFTTEPVAYPIENITATASSAHQADMGPENTVNGSGLDDNGLHSVEANNMWLSGNEPLGAWIEFQFDRAYKLHQMWVWNSNQAIESLVGFGLKGVTIEYSTNGTDYATLGTTHEFVQATGMPDYEHNTTVSFDGAVAKYVRITAQSNWGMLPQFGLSEVRFFYIPVWAREPSPDSGATDVDVDVVLGWRAGRGATSHDVYVSTDEQAVIDGTAPAATVTETSHGPLSLDLGKTYYWKINEVNTAETPTTLEGDIWNLTTREFLVVDDFESYNDLDPDDPESNRIFNMWIDGYEQPENGSLVGYDVAPFAEQSIVHSGKQAMPLSYDNTGTATYSEAELTLSSSQDWTKAGVATLVLYFHGAPGNTGQLYMKINDSKVVYDGDAADIATLRWKQWNIDLASSGASLQNVTKLSIGIDGIGASGTLYVDDILLYRLAPEIVVPSEEIWIEAEAADTITEPMKIYDDPAASGGKYIGTTDDIGNSSNSPPTPAGTASYTFAVAGGTYKISGRINIPSGNNSFWVQIKGATTPAETELHSSGWVRWNDPPDTANWFWNDVFSDDDDQDATVLFTMPAGTYTLEIAYRETGAMLDAIVISKID
ncbi:MAG: discoidin domain-containing protein [Planctomycetota bacterium]